MIETIGTSGHHKARKAAAVRFGKVEEAAEADRDLRAANLARAIEIAVAGAPPLTDSQRLALAGLLVGGGA